MIGTVFYSINTNRFAHETVDGEVIVIDMDEGNYFSMRGTAAVIWSLVDQGLTEAELVAALEKATGASASEITAGVSAFLEHLVNESILHASAPQPGRNPVIGPLPQMEFQIPAVEKFTEMQDLLTLDPIHEVDETGWPRRAG